MESGYLSSSRGGRRKIFRDNVHGYIDVPYSVVSELIDTPLFQRLRNIEQTSMRPLFPSAHHDRFIHSLGTYYLGAKAFDCLERNARASEEPIRSDEESSNGELSHLGEGDPSFDLEAYLRRRRGLFLIACLLHDCGHAPFSHTFEAYYTLEKTDDVMRLDAELRNEYAGDAAFAEDYKMLCDKGCEPAPHEQMSALLVGRYFRAGIESVFSSEGLEKPTEPEFALMARMIIGCIYEGDITEAQSFDNCLISLLNSSTVDVDGLDYSTRDTVNSGILNTNIDYDRLLGSLSAPVASHFGSARSSASGQKETERFVQIERANFRGVFSIHTELCAQSDDEALDSAGVKNLSGDVTLEFDCEDSADSFCDKLKESGISAYPDNKIETVVALRGLHDANLPKDVNIKRIQLDSYCSLTLTNWTGRIRGDALLTPEYVKSHAGTVAGKMSRRHVLAFGKSSMISLEGALNARNLLYRQIYSHPQVLYRSSFLLPHMLALSAKYLCCRQSAADFATGSYPIETCKSDDCPKKMRRQDGDLGGALPEKPDETNDNLEVVILEILGFDGFFSGHDDGYGTSEESGACSGWHFDKSDDSDLLTLFKWVYRDNHSRPKGARNEEIERYFGEYFGRKGKKALWKSYEEYRHFLSVHREEGLREIDFKIDLEGDTNPYNDEYVLISNDGAGGAGTREPICNYTNAGYEGLLAIKASQKVKTIDYDATFVKFPDGIERFSDVTGFQPMSGKNDFCYLFCDSGPGIPSK